MTKGRYVLASVEKLEGTSVRARVCGPGAPSGVCYWVPSADEAMHLVETLNLCDAYASELHRMRACQRPRRARK
jgi:hypothetical protein